MSVVRTLELVYDMGFSLCRDACCVPCSVAVDEDSVDVCQRR